MKSFKDYLIAAGETLPYPAATYRWVAYKAGKVSEHATRHEAAEVSSNIERIETEESSNIRSKVFDHNLKIEQAACDAWWKDFKLQHQTMPVKLFDVLYAEAYDQSHPYGYDAIADKFEILADFAERIINATK